MRGVLFLAPIFAIFLAGCFAKDVSASPPTVTVDLPLSDKSQKRGFYRDKLSCVDSFVDFGFTKSLTQRKIDTLVVHTAYSPDKEPYVFSSLIEIFRAYDVAPHYVIAREGQIYKTVDENDIAHHAGKSAMKDGRTGVNAFSIGVELINTITDYPTKEQYKSLAALIKNIKTRHKIEHIVGHSDIAPDRKTDPWNFDFTLLNKALLGGEL